MPDNIPTEPTGSQARQEAFMQTLGEKLYGEIESLDKLAINVPDVRDIEHGFGKLTYQDGEESGYEIAFFAQIKGIGMGLVTLWKGNKNRKYGDYFNGLGLNSPYQLDVDLHTDDQTMEQELKSEVRNVFAGNTYELGKNSQGKFIFGKVAKIRQQGKDEKRRPVLDTMHTSLGYFEMVPSEFTGIDAELVGKALELLKKKLQALQENPTSEE